MASRRQRRFRRWIVRALAVGCVAAIGGAIYQAWCVRLERERFPAQGQLIDVGGRRLHLICLGQGSPVVIFEQSMFGGALSSGVAREAIAGTTRVCSYDRRGMGWSDPTPGPISTGALVDDFERLLDRAALPPPYVLVPSSIGGLTAELFARRHPDRVAGLVWLDAANAAGLRLASERMSAMQRSALTLAACLPKAAAPIGLLRLVDPWGFRARGDDRAIAALYRSEPMTTTCGMVRGWATSLAELAAAPLLKSDIPLAVLSAETTTNLVPPGLDRWAGPFIAERIPIAQAFAKTSTRGTWRLVPGSDHLIGASQPAAVAEAVIEVIHRVSRKP